MSGGYFDLRGVPLPFKRIIMSLVWLLALLFSGKNLSYASDRTVDLGSEFRSGESVSLRGPWAFYWQKLLLPSNHDPEPDLWMNRISFWSYHRDQEGKPFPYKGSGTYKLKLTGIPEGASQLYFVVPGSTGATRLIVFDPLREKILLDMSSGQVDEKVYQISRKSILAHVSAESVNELVVYLHVRSHEFVEGGMPPYAPPMISLGEGAWTKIFGFAVIDLLGIGICFTLGMYNGLVWMKRRSEIAAFYLALGAIVGSMRMIGMSFITTKLLPDEAAILLRRFEFLPIMLGPYCMFQFHSHVFGWSPLSERNKNIFNTFTLCVALLPLLLPGLSFSHGLPLYNTIVLTYCFLTGIILWKAFRNHFEDADLSMASSGILILFISHDVILVFLLGLSDFQGLSIGISIYYLIQSYIVAHRVEIADQLAKDLAVKNEAIEKSLRFESNERLSLAASVAHRINNPLNYIQISTDILHNNIEKIQEILLVMVGSDPSDDPEVRKIQLDLEKVFGEVQASFQTMESGLTRAVHAVSEIRAISGVDGTPLTNINLNGILPSCIQHLREHQSIERCRRLRYHPKMGGDAQLFCNEPILKNAVEILLMSALDSSSGDVVIMDKQDDPGTFRLLLGGSFNIQAEDQERLKTRLSYILRVTALDIECAFTREYWTIHLMQIHQSDPLAA